MRSKTDYITNSMALFAMQNESHLTPSNQRGSAIAQFSAFSTKNSIYQFLPYYIYAKQSQYILTPDEATFRSLLTKWHDERGATSSITEMVLCRSYLQIIAMGSKAIPLIFRQMEQEADEPDMWFVALQVITSADPVTPEARGNFKAMADLWIHWGRINGYAW